ncbi:MAG: D-alanine--D-alanine ligase family protein [Bacteroidales bacterium]
MRKKVALIYGGNSSEAEISIKSGMNVSANINRNEYDVYEILLRGGSWRVLNPNGGLVSEKVAVEYLKCVMASEVAFNTGVGGAKIENIKSDIGLEVNKVDFSFENNGEKINFDLAFIMIHGTPGENGLLQGYLEMMMIPYNSCSSFVSSITFDKHSCKRFLDFAGVNLAKDVFLHRGDSYDVNEIVKKVGLPMFVKPTNGGSSFGVTKVKRVEDLKAAIDFVFSGYDAAIIEEFIKGRELTNGIYNKGNEIVRLPVTEIITEREFFDYEAKYLGESKEVCPAQISDELTLKIQELSEKLYKYLGCKGLVRMDYIAKGDDIYFLEINTVPGMTSMSLVPAQVRVAGINMQEFFTTLIEGR